MLGLKKTTIERLEVLYPIIRILIVFLVDCYAVFDSRDVEALDAFIAKYKVCDIDALSQFANGLLKDYDAVKNSLIYNEISNGPTEGCNTRLKMTHRRCGGRADLELLNAFAVLWSNRVTRSETPVKTAS
jgi:hypothetical protein